MNCVAISSLEAGIIVSIVTQPFWVIKTRMLLNVDPHTSEVKNFFDKSKEIYHQHKVKGFMKGLSLNIWLSALGISQMFFYEGSKVLYNRLNIPESAMEEKNFICGGISKILSGLIMYPLTTVRTRIQQNQFIRYGNEQKYKGNWDIITRTAREEGMRGFYKGLWANIIKGIPQKGIYFYFY
jgi:solute carrier family 25 (mitochondrial folate transporter), member 32